MNLDEQRRIANAIADAEDGTTGRIAVRVVPDRKLDAFERAKREFGRHGLHLHAHENAALVLVAPNARRYAILGDKALHDRVGDAFWDDAIVAVKPYFERGAIVEGIVHAIERVGAALHEHFIARAGDE